MIRLRTKLLVLGVWVALGVNVQGVSVTQREVQIPTPDVAAQQAEKMAPEAIAQVEIDEVIRDRLRFDPQWQPILQAIREDIITLKWGDGKLKNPVWQRYGEKAYPLLEYYSHTGDETRQAYGIAGIINLGKPYTTLWLTQQIQRRAGGYSFELIRSKPETLYGPNSYESEDEKVWQERFGLNDPQFRAKLIQLAKANLEPPNSPRYYDQFNLALLSVLTDRSPYDSSEREKSIPNLSQWTKFERITQPTSNQIQQAIATYRQLPTDAREYILVKRLGEVKAGKISALGKGLLKAIATSQDSDRTWAIAELDRHGDPQASAQLQQILNGNLRELHQLTKTVFYGFTQDGLDRGPHAYYLLVGMAQKYPQSKFIQACKEYGNLTGRSYFGGESRSPQILAQIRKKTAAQKTQAWTTWLSRYADHPGADDAMDFLARSLQAQGDILGAMRVWLKLMTTPTGDNDARYLAYPHVRTLLDVGLSAEQIQTLLNEKETAEISPLLQYALSVKYARSHNYAKALDTSERLDLTTMPTRILDSYYSANWAWWDDTKANEIQKEMQTMLIEQRQRWRELLALQKQNTVESRYQIASNWGGAGGWKNGYLSLWDEGRTYYLPMTYSTSTRYPVEDNDRWDCRYWWVCDLGKRGETTVRTAYQMASQNAVAIALYQQLLNDPKTSPAIREKTLYMTAMTLLWQWENHNPDETLRIHPPVGVPMGGKIIDQYSGEASPNIESAYQSRIDGIITELQVKFPNSAYTDDLLFSSYFLSGRSTYLKQLIDRYPTSDRAQEAKFLLAHPIANRTF
ncbi:hypothetical protein ACKFKG_26420 [Phormidesmis sp. 146-35]